MQSFLLKLLHVCIKPRVHIKNEHEHTHTNIHERMNVDVMTNKNKYKQIAWFVNERDPSLVGNQKGVELISIMLLSKYK